MDKLLKPDRLEIDTNSSNAAQLWTHWKRTFENFLEAAKISEDLQKYNILINYVSSSVYEPISETKSYEDAVAILEKLYVKPRSEIFARHTLSTRKQQVSTNGTSIPTWLSTPGPVYLKKHVKQSKYDPLVEEVELLEANSDYAHVRLSNGNEVTVSTRHLAPRGDISLQEIQGYEALESISLEENSPNSYPDNSQPNSNFESLPSPTSAHENESDSHTQNEIRPSISSDDSTDANTTVQVSEKRIRKPPSYLQDYVRN